MQFSEGQIIVHPHHGPAIVTGVTTRVIRGVPTDYLDLAIHHTNLTVAVPVASADEVGLRRVLDATGRQRLLDVLRAPTEHEEQGWSRRFKENQERLRTGDLQQIAVVVRDLTRRQSTKGVSAGEKDLLKHARQPLVTEFALSLSLTDEEAEEAVEAAILRQETPLPRTLAAAS
jgi:CarD family transcriptional regulator